MKRLLQKKTWLETLTTYDIELVEIMSGVAGVAWGIWLLNPHFKTFHGSHGYVAMSSIAPEGYWGGLMLVVGILLLMGVVTHNIAMRKKTSLFLGILWLFIATMIGISNIKSTGVPIYGVFAGFTLWSYLRLSQRVEIKSKFNKR